MFLTLKLIKEMKKIIFVHGNNEAKVIEVNDEVNTVSKLKDALVSQGVVTTDDFRNAYLYEGLSKVQLESDESPIPEQREFGFNGETGMFNVIALRPKTYKEKYENGVVTLEDEFNKLISLREQEIDILKNISELLSTDSKSKSTNPFPEGFNPFGLDKKEDDEDDEEYEEEEE